MSVFPIEIQDTTYGSPGASRKAFEERVEHGVVAAGLMDDVRMMVPRLNEIIANALEHGNKGMHHSTQNIFGPYKSAVEHRKTRHH